MAKTKPAFGPVACLALLVAGAFCLGTSLRPQSAARAGVRETTPREHFLAGSERSLPVLQEISTTLKQIDGRLSRIEKAVATAAQRQDNR